MKTIYRFGLAGAVLILATNIVVLSRVAYNRSGEPDAVLALTERELAAPYRRGRDNSGLSLQLQWRMANAAKPDHDNRWDSADWLNAEKLETLGFRIAALKNRRAYRKRRKDTLARQVLIVLEYDGNAYARAVARAKAQLASAMAAANDQPGNSEANRRLKNARMKVDHESRAATRLFAVDAGTDPAKLRVRYPDRNRYLIVRGMVDLRYGPKPGFEPRGYISRLLNNSLNVSLAQRSVIEDATAGGRSRLAFGKQPRYSIELACGRSLEPWIRGAARLAGI